METNRTAAQETRTRAIELECRAVEGSENRFELSFSSEDPYVRWGRPEILVHSEDAVDLSRFGDVGTVLFSHGMDPNIGRMPVGKIERAWLDPESRKCRAVISFDEDDEAARKIKSKMEKGMLRGVSVGYRVNEWELLNRGERSADGRFVGPCDLAMKWTPHEISVEPTPADPTVGFGKSMQAEEQTRGGIEMSEGIKNIAPAEAAGQQGTAAAQASAAIAETERARILEEERTRVNDISALCRQFEVDADQYIRSGASLDQVRAGILDYISKERGAVAVEKIQVVGSELDNVRSAAVDGLLMRSGAQIEKPATGAESFRGMRLRDIAVESLSLQGERNANRMSNEEIFQRVMTPNSHFAGILTDTVRKVMATEYKAANTTFQQWTSVGSSTDFKPTKIYQISEAGELKLITQNDELTRDEMNTAQMAERRLLTFGRMWGFDRQALINDDIGLLTKVPAAYVRAAQRGLNKAVYDLLKQNPVMADAKALFSAAHGNLGAAGLPSTAAYGAAIAAMRKQKNLRGMEVLNITPRFILSPAELEVAHRQMLVSTGDPDGGHAGVANIFRNSLTLIVDAELDLEEGNSPYYFVASPNDCDTIEVSYLNGNQSPMLESQVGFDYLGIKFRIIHDRGITLIDHRGMFKQPQV